MIGSLANLEGYSPGAMFDPTNEAIERYAAAIKGIESSGGNYGAVGSPVKRKGGRFDRAYGAYQIMGDNLPQWTQAALGAPMGAAEFLKSKAAQDAVFRHRFQNFIDQYGSPEAAARVWYGGPKAATGKSGVTDLHGRLTVQGYGRDFTNRLGGHHAATPVASDTSVVAASPALANVLAYAPAPGAAKPTPGAGSPAPPDLNWFTRNAYLQRDPETGDYLDPELARQVMGSVLGGA